MWNFSLAAALLLLSITAVADLADDVRCHEIAFSKAAERRDVDEFRSFIDVDARFIGSIVNRGREEITAAWQPFFSIDGPAIKWRPQFIEVLANGNLALTRGPYRMISKDPDGNTVEHWGTFNSVWRKNEDGEWQVIFDAGNSAAAPPDAETQALLALEADCE
jgi:ketosteroid isomerase-like protein